MPPERQDLPSVFLEAVQDYGMFMLAPKGIVISWNMGAERILGYRAVEVVGKHFSLFYPDEFRVAHALDQQLRLALARGKYEEEGWRIRKDGTSFWAGVVITPLFDDRGVLTGFGKIIHDLTERRTNEETQRQVEETVRQSEERFRLLVDGVRDYAIYMLDPQGDVQSWNRGAELIKGYCAQEAIGQHYSMFFREKDRLEGLPAWQLQRALLHGRTEEEGWRVRKDGSTFWANIVLTSILTNEGALAGYAKVTRDMTERVRLHELEHSLQRMNEFLATLGHELRAPLAPMKYVVDLMKMEPSPNRKLPAYHEVLERQLTNLTRLMDDLLDAGRLTSGKFHVKPQLIDFKDVMAQVLEQARPAINAKSQVLNVNLPPGDISINADALRIVQLLHNLLSNASQFTPEGGRIEVRGNVVDERLRVDVTDNGVGMDPAAIDKVFVLFAQGATAHEARHAGLGIGLALARSIVELHGGSISAASAGVGKGSTFSFELPGASHKEHSTASSSQ